MHQVFSLWFGNRLNDICRMAITSFIQKGVEFTLYTYTPVKNLPEGVIVKDANEIFKFLSLPLSVQIYFDSNRQIFADYFRYHALYKNGGIWVDTDTFLNDISFFPLTDYAFFAERIMFPEQKVPLNPALFGNYFGFNYKMSIGIHFLKLPPKSALMQEALEIFEKYFVDDALKTLSYGSLGPYLINYLIGKHTLVDYIYPPKMTFPFGTENALGIFIPELCQEFQEKISKTFCYHLFNGQIASLHQIPTNVKPPVGSFLEKLYQENNFFPEGQQLHIQSFEYLKQKYGFDDVVNLKYFLE